MIAVPTNITSERQLIILVAQVLADANRVFVWLMHRCVDFGAVLITLFPKLAVLLGITTLGRVAF